MSTEDRGGAHAADLRPQPRPVRHQAGGLQVAPQTGQAPLAAGGAAVLRPAGPRPGPGRRVLPVEGEVGEVDVVVGEALLAAAVGLAGEPHQTVFVEVQSGTADSLELTVTN